MHLNDILVHSKLGVQPLLRSVEVLVYDAPSFRQAMLIIKKLGTGTHGTESNAVRRTSQTFWSIIHVEIILVI